MRFPAALSWWVGGERYPVKRVRSIGGHGSGDKGSAECDTTEKVTRLLHKYPTFTNELMNVLHENTEEIVTELHIDPLEQNGKDEEEDRRNDAYVDLIAHGRAQFLHSLIEQGLLAWGPAMIEHNEDREALAGVNVQLLRTLIEQGILAWGPAITRSQEDAQETP